MFSTVPHGAFALLPHSFFIHYHPLCQMTQMSPLLSSPCLSISARWLKIFRLCPYSCSLLLNHNPFPLFPYYLCLRSPQACPRHSAENPKSISFKTGVDFFFFFFFSTLSLSGNSGRLTMVKHSSRKSSATHSYQCLQCFRVSRQCYGCQFGIFGARPDVDACHCTRELYGHRRGVCTKSWFWGKDPLPHRGLEPASTLLALGQTIQYNIILLSLCREICFLARHLHKNIQYS